MLTKNHAACLLVLHISTNKYYSYVFGLPERREYPMPDAAHVRAAEAYFRYCPEDLKPRLAKAIMARAAEYGVDVESPTVRQYAEM